MIKFDVMKKVFIKTFGCIQNTADSERIKAYFEEQNQILINNWKEADLVVINTCVIRQSAENRAYGLINEIEKRNPKAKIWVTGCLVGVYDRKNKLNILKEKFERVDDWKPIEFFNNYFPNVDRKQKLAMVTITNGCNNFCSYCIVPFARGKEISKPFDLVIKEVNQAIENGLEEVLLIGQNVNSYGADFGEESWVSMGKKRFKSYFPKLLETIAQMNFKKISFVSSNPWDFSDELIEVIAKYPNVDRLLHLPFQAGNDQVLKNMNRGYSQKEYLDLVKKIKSKVSGVKFSTDIIIGFPGEGEKEFEDTVKVCREVGFEIAYLNKYSPRAGTVSAKNYQDEIPMSEKKRRWKILNELVNVKI